MTDNSVSHEIATLALLSHRAAYEQYAAGVPDAALSPEVAEILRDFGAYFKEFAHADAVDWPTFCAWWRHTRHPGAKPERGHMLDAIAQRVATLPPLSPDMTNALTSGWHTAAFVQGLAELALRARQSGFRKDIRADVAKLIDRYAARAASAGAAVKPFTLENAFPEAAAHVGDGWNWRIEELNQILGPLRRRNLILVGARPEIGKTSFVTSELCHMLTQAPGETALWVNNEESADRLMVRHICAVLNRRGVVIAENKAAAYEHALKRAKWTKDTVQFLEAHDLSLPQIEAAIAQVNPSIVILHRIDKMAGLIESDANDVQRLEQIAFWARRLAAPSAGPGRAVIAVMQADISAEGEQYPDDSQLYRSKTGLQSEMDAIIMIGAKDKTGDRRGVNVPRNKLLGGPRSIESKRHGRFECVFDHITGRFSSIAYATRSE